MSIFQLLCFVTLAGATTFSEAAEKLYISQSSFSNNIQTIEKELGVNLVTRERGALALTEAGCAFLKYAKKITDEYEHINKILKDYRLSSEKRVTIYTDPLSSYGYNALLTNFKLHFPEIQTEFIELVEDNVTGNISNIQKDVVRILFSTNKTPDLGTKCHTLVSDRLAALVDKSHYLAKSKRVQLHDIGYEQVQVISSRQSRFLNEFTLEQFKKSALFPNIAPLDLWYNTARESIRELGIPAILPERVAQIFCEQDMKVIGIDSEKFHIKIVISEECEHETAQIFYNFAIGIS